MKWSYEAHDAAGRLRQGDVEANSYEDAVSIVRNELVLFARKIEPSSSELPLNPAPETKKPEVKKEESSTVDPEAKKKSYSVHNGLSYEQVDMKTYVNEQLNLIDIVLKEIEARYPTRSEIVNLARSKMVENLCCKIMA